MALIVTGASGNFGRAAVAGLLKHVPATELILLSRDPGKLARYAQLGAQVRHGDFDDPASLATGFAGGHKMLMISAMRVGKRVRPHTNAIQAAVQAGVQHIVYTSSIGADPDNPSLAVNDHRVTEEVLRASGIAWTALRDSQYTDAVIEAAAPLAIATGRWLSSSAPGQIAPVVRQDCVDCAVAVLAGSGHQNVVYNITGPELLSYRDIAGIVAEVSGKPVEYRAVSDDEMYALFDSMGIPREPVDDHVVGGVPWCSDDMVSYERSIREGRFAVISDDVRKLTGHAPKSVRAFAQEQRAAMLPQR
jgi:NAD(P)H dehydrogenase (quinone)